jgi:hypothetical protein
MESLSDPAVPDLPSSRTSLAAPVVAAVLTVAGESLDLTLGAIARQVYGEVPVVLVGPEAGVTQHRRVGSLAELTAQLDPAVPYVWLLHGDARPRPDALQALVAEIERSDGSVAGSKILLDEGGDRLESVGGSTDVFGEPYGIIDQEEVDLEQYDVVRDVAYVSPVSMLVRRDLLRGLGGIDPKLAPQAAGLDISQRARLAGGRVIVVPSSEVFHRGGCEARVPAWREQAGRMRAMLKAYRPVTLAWVVPVGFLIGLVDGLGQLLLGRPRALSRFLAAFLWNLAQLPSSLVARRGVRAIRQVPDEELFRYQVGGSVKLRDLGSELAERVTIALDDQEPGLAGRARALWKRPDLVSGAVTVLLAALATRSIWLDHTPAAGMTLPLSEAAGDTLAAYAGGVNPAGLGGRYPLPSAVAAAALVQLVTLGRAGAAQALITVVAAVAAVTGFASMSRRLGLSGPMRYAAGLVYAGGWAMAAVGADGAWPAMVAAGAIPWALRSALGERPSGGWGWAARIAQTALASGPALLFQPVSGLALLAVALLWSLLSGRWIGSARMLAGVVAGLGLVGPFLWTGSGPPPPLQVPVWWLIAAGAGLIVGLFGARDEKPASLAGLLIFGGLATTRAPGITEAGWWTALLVVALGEAILTAVLLSMAGGAAKRGTAVLLGVALIAPVTTYVAGGRAGLPADQWSRRLEFAEVLSDTPERERILLVGPTQSLPGSSRSFEGVGYRLANATGITFDQAVLPPPIAEDIALEAALAEVASARSVRPGRLLAPFAIRWLVLLPGQTPFDEALSRQVDLVPLPVDPDLLVYENLAASTQDQLPVGGSAIDVPDPSRRAAAVGSLIYAAVLVVVAMRGRRR